MHATITNAPGRGNNLRYHKRITEKAIRWMLIVSILTGISAMLAYSPWHSGSTHVGKCVQLHQSTQNNNTMAKGKFELFHNTADKHYYFHLKATNGQVILESQRYDSKQSCMEGIHSVQTNAPIDERYERTNGETQWSFDLKAANGEVIGKSQGYTSLSARENGIRSVKHNAPSAKINDLSVN